MPLTDTVEARFGIVVKHPGLNLVLLVLGPIGRDAQAMVIRDSSNLSTQWPVGHIETISRAGWIILDEGLDATG